MEIPNVFSDYISIAKDGNPRFFEDFRLYSLIKGWKSPMFPSFRLYSLFKGRKSMKFMAKNIMSNKVLIQLYNAHTIDF